MRRRIGHDPLMTVPVRRGGLSSRLTDYARTYSSSKSHRRLLKEIEALAMLPERGARREIARLEARVDSIAAKCTAT